MNINFEQDYLSQLYYDGKCKDKRNRIHPDIVKRYIRTIDILESVEKTEELYNFHALNYEVLVGDMRGLESVRVDNKYRLIFKTSTHENDMTTTICNTLDLTNHCK